MPYGSGSQLLGGTGALEEAMRRRGIDASALQQVSASAPTYNPQTAPVAPTQATSAPQANVPAPSGGMTAQGQRQLSGASSEAEIIIKALTKRLSDLSSLGQ